MGIGEELNNVLRYSTRKVVVIDNIGIGILYRFLQLCVLAYFVGYVIFSQEKYTKTDPVPIHLSTRVIGNQALLDTANNIQYVDAMDIVAPDLYLTNTIHFGIRVSK